MQAQYSDGDRRCLTLNIATAGQTVAPSSNPVPGPVRWCRIDPFKRQMEPFRTVPPVKNRPESSSSLTVDCRKPLKLHDTVQIKLGSQNARRRDVGAMAIRGSN